MRRTTILAAGAALLVQAVALALLLSSRVEPPAGLTIAGVWRDEAFVRGSIAAQIQQDPGLCIALESAAERGSLRRYILDRGAIRTEREVDRYIALTLEECAVDQRRARLGGAHAQVPDRIGSAAMPTPTIYDYLDALRAGDTSAFAPTPPPPPPAKAPKARPAPAASQPGLGL